jgi:L-ascorbate metabolism protein UlaG (beta-lactamase superfamily)
MPQRFETDRFETSDGSLEITFLGHGSLLFAFRGETIYVDPFSRVADYKKLPKADLVLITHEHRDHLDPDALKSVVGKETDIVSTEICAKSLGRGIVMRNGDRREVRGLSIEAVPAYNVEHQRESGEPFHPRGHGNGYVISFGGLRVYVAGDTENTPEVKALRDVDVAFLPMNVPYTMTPQMVADAAVAMKPGVVYPYHFGSTDPAELVKLLAGHPEIEVRVRSLS